MSPPGLRFGSRLRARSRKIMPCQRSTARWPPGTDRAPPQCTGYRNHNNLRGHNISAHRRHTPRTQAHSTSTPQRGTLQSWEESPASAGNPCAHQNSVSMKEATEKKGPQSMAKRRSPFKRPDGSRHGRFHGDLTRPLQGELRCWSR